MEFIKYTTLYGKSYGTKEEFDFRSTLFKKTLDFIRTENSRIENTFTVGVNKFADWTPAEYKRLLGYKPAAKKEPVSYFNETNIAIPTSVDWRTSGDVNEVQDQGLCGSDWAFSAIATTESRTKIAMGTLYKLSEQQLVDCCLYGSCIGCGGGDEDIAFDYIKDKGVMLLKDYPYTSFDGNCIYNSLKVIAASKNIGTTMVKPYSFMALKTAIASGPVSVAVESKSTVFQFYSGGILNSDSCGIDDIDHPVVAVGYGVDPTKGEYYIVRNSWGPKWGLNGYIYIAGGKDGPGICGI
jgi:KDEL-tailed cysteine endopeptidase